MICRSIRLSADFKPGPRGARLKTAARLLIVASNERLARKQAAVDLLPRLLNDLEAPPIDEASRARLVRKTEIHGAPFTTLLIRTIIESEGNQNALVTPVIDAVASVMSCQPLWPERGIAWIEAFDHLPLMQIVATMRSLDLFSEKSLPHYLFMVIRNKLWDTFDPPAPLKMKPRPKIGRKQSRKTPRYTKAASRVTLPRVHSSAETA